MLGRVDGFGAWAWKQTLISKQAVCKKNVRTDAIDLVFWNINSTIQLNDSHPNAGVVDEHQSAFADHILCNLGKGAESCAGLQQAAAAVVVESQGHCSQLTKQLASIGTAGANSRNCERDLFRLLRLPIEPWLMKCSIVKHWNSQSYFSKKQMMTCSLLLVLFTNKDPFFVTIRVRDKSKPKGTKGHITNLRCPILLPHEVLHHLASTGQVKVSKDEVAGYWQHWKGRKPTHPAESSAVHTPCGIGGDDAKYTLAGAKVVIVCMNNILWDRKFRDGNKVDSTSSFILVRKLFGLLPKSFFFNH